MKINNLSFYPRLILAIASGAVVIPLSYLEKYNIPDILNISITDILIGAVFALFVMAHFQRRWSWFKTLAMIIASIGIYTFVAKLATNNYHLVSLDLSLTTGIIVSGGLGALLTGLATQLFSPLRLTINAYATLVTLGAAAGYVFSLCIDSESIYINAIGFISWQTTVFLIMYFRKRKSSIFL